MCYVCIDEEGQLKFVINFRVWAYSSELMYEGYI